MVRGARVVDAENTLRSMPQKGAVMVAAALKSAVANAENNYNMRKTGLHINAITVNEGPTLKRIRPRSRGMANPILHRMSHLTVVLSDTVVEKKSKKPTKVVKNPAPKKAVKTESKKETI
jgi:large subunit ribosomal protein L22